MRVIRMPRGPVAVLFEVVFYLFNVVMAGVLVSAWARIGNVAATMNTEAAQSVAGLAGFMGTAMILGIWAAGTIILGALVLVSRGRRIVVEERDES